MTIMHLGIPHRPILLLFCVAATLSIHSQTITAQLPVMPAGLGCYPDTTGYQKISVCPSGCDYTDIQQAIDSAELGTIISIEPGHEYLAEAIKLKKKITGSGWVIIQSARMDLLPVFGNRVDPDAPTGNGIYPTQKDAMPKLRPYKYPPTVWGRFRNPVITTPDGGTDHYWISGLDMSVDDADSTLHYQTVVFGYDPSGCCGPKQDSLWKVPNYLTLDRNFIHGKEKCDCGMGIAINSANTVVIGNYIDEFHINGADGGYGMIGWNGPGPFKIINNFVQAAGINVFFGGSNGIIDSMIPSDIELKNNTISKNFRWFHNSPLFDKTRYHYVKNLFEVKNGQRVLAEGNIFENSWEDTTGFGGQCGSAIVLTIRPMIGVLKPWVTVSNITIRNNIIRHVAFGLNLMGEDYVPGSDTDPGKNWIIENNLFYDLDTIYGYTLGGVFMKTDSTMNVLVRHNTIENKNYIHDAYPGAPYKNIGKMIYFGRKSENLQFEDNIVFHGSGTQTNTNSGFGRWVFYKTGDITQGSFIQSLSPYSKSDIEDRWKNNLFITDTINCARVNDTIYGNAINPWNVEIYPFSNFTTPDVKKVGFKDYLNAYSDYRNFELASSSIYKGKASDGQDIGADILKIYDVVNNGVLPNTPGPISGFTSICAGTINTYSLVPVNGASSYNWTLPSGWIGNSTSNVISTTANTLGGSILVTASKTCFTTTASSQAITVNSLPSVIVTGNSSVCNGASSLVTANGASAYVWNTGATTSSVMVSPTQNTSYTVTGTDVNACSNIASINLAVIPLPGVTTSLNGNVISANENGATYQWLDCLSNSIISGATNQSYSVTSNGSYAVVVTLNGCGDTSACSSFTTVGIVGSDLNSGIAIFPSISGGFYEVENPASNTLGIDVYNLLGERMTSIISIQRRTVVDISDKPAGIYFIVMRTEGPAFARKVIKE